MPQYEIDFHEYVPYTPTADELDLEKQFGIKPIPHPPRPESAIVKPQRASGSATWLYAAGAAVLLVALGLGLYLYRRSRRAD